MRHVDSLIIGAGQAGPPLAARLAAAGRAVVLVERGNVGGTCVNNGCTPTKALVASAKVADRCRHAAEYGVHCDVTDTNIIETLARARRIAADSRAHLEEWIEGLDDVELVRGDARFVGERTVEVGDERIEAREVFLNVGGRPNLPPLPGIDTVDVLTNENILDLAERPEHLVVVGGSYIGLEFAQAFARLGCKVTVVEMADRLIGREDPEISDAVRAVLEKDGIAIRTGATCITLQRTAGVVSVGVDCKDGAPREEGSHVLLAIGRRPNTDTLALEATGVSLDERGFVIVNDRLETSCPGIWAMGDCNGRGAFTHTAYNDYEIVAANLLDGEKRSVTARGQGYALFIDPPLGRAGMTEAQARAAGLQVRTTIKPMDRVGRAIEKGETDGLIKLVGTADGKLLGAAMFGVGGDEAVHWCLEILATQRPLKDARWTVPVHPTVAEWLPTLFGDLLAQKA